MARFSVLVGGLCLLVATAFVSQTVAAPLSGLDAREGDEISPASLPAGLRSEYDRLSSEAAAKARKRLAGVALNTAGTTMHLDKNGDVYVADTFNKKAQPARRSVTRDVQRMRRMFSGTAATKFVGGIPIHHSLPGAPNVIYIDFNGMVITGTVWNEEYSEPIYNARPYDLDGNSASFSEFEQLSMSRIWNRMAEDFAPFNVDVTTEEPLTFGPTTARYLVTFSTDAQGRNMPESGAGGVAYLNVFGESYFPDYSPAFGYCNNMVNGREDAMAETGSHEIGHNLGLTHDGTSALEYYPGNALWGPIMGDTINNQVTLFDNGSYLDANNNQDDLAVISGKLGYRTDDHGNTIATARVLAVVAGKATASGIIERNTDFDVFSVTASGAGTISVIVATFVNPTSSPGANLDVLLRVTNAGNTALGTFSSTATTSASLANIALPSAGTYYIWVSGTGNAAAPYPAYASLGQYKVDVTLNVVAAPTTTKAITTTKANVATTLGPTVVIYFNALSTSTSIASWTQVAPLPQFRIWQWGKPTALNHPRDRNVLGTVITGTGLYPEGIPSTVTIISTSINTQNYKNLKFSFSRFLGVAADDVATFWVCPAGKACIILWTNAAKAVADKVWTRVSYDLPVSAEGASIRVRFGLGPTKTGAGGVLTSGPGWSISNLQLTGRLSSGGAASASEEDTSVSEGVPIEVIPESP